MPMERWRYPEDWERIAREVKDEAGWRCRAEYLTHERPDSWARWIEDAGKSTCEYFGSFGTSCDGCQHDPCMCNNDRNEDLVRRAKKLAERGQ